VETPLLKEITENVKRKANNRKYLCS